MAITNPGKLEHLSPYISTYSILSGLTVTHGVSPAQNFHISFTELSALCSHLLHTIGHVSVTVWQNIILNDEELKRGSFTSVSSNPSVAPTSCKIGFVEPTHSRSSVKR